MNIAGSSRGQNPGLGGPLFPLAPRLLAEGRLQPVDGGGVERPHLLPHPQLRHLPPSPMSVLPS